MRLPRRFCWPVSAWAHELDAKIFADSPTKPGPVGCPMLRHVEVERVGKQHVVTDANPSTSRAKIPNDARNRAFLEGQRREQHCAHPLVLPLLARHYLSYP